MQVKKKKPLKNKNKKTSNTFNIEFNNKYFNQVWYTKEAF